MTFAVGGNIGLEFVRTVRGRDGSAYREWTYKGTREACEARFYLNWALEEFGEVLLEQPQNGLGAWRVILREDIVQSEENPISEGVRIVANPVQKSLFEPPLPPAFANVDDIELEVIQDALRGDENARDTIENWTTPETSAARRLYFYGLRGVQYRTVYQQQLIKTITSNKTFQWQLSYTNVGRIIPESQIIADAGIQGILRFGLPANAPSGIEGFEYGWLKAAPSVEQSTGSVELLTQQYDYGLWPFDLYP